MRSLVRRIEEMTQEPMPQDALKGMLNPKQLAELLGIDDLPLFTRSIRKVQAGDTDKLTRAEMTELAVAFVNLLAAEPEDTQKAMMAIKRVSAKEEPVMEDATSKPRIDEMATGLSKSDMKLILKYSNSWLKKLKAGEVEDDPDTTPQIRKLVTRISKPNAQPKISPKENLAFTTILQDLVGFYGGTDEEKIDRLLDKLEDLQ